MPRNWNGQRIERLRKTPARDVAGTLQAANDLSAAVADLFAVYNPATPADLSRLDALGRQVGLDVAAGDFGAASDSLAKTNAIWARLKPVVLMHSGAAVAARYESSLASQQQALQRKNAAGRRARQRAGWIWSTRWRISFESAWRGLGGGSASPQPSNFGRCPAHSYRTAAKEKIFRRGFKPLRASPMQRGGRA